jgi:hypothetical protein
MCSCSDNGHFVSRRILFCDSILMAVIYFPVEVQCQWVEECGDGIMIPFFYDGNTLFCVS